MLKPLILGALALILLVGAGCQKGDKAGNTTGAEVAKRPAAAEQANTNPDALPEVHGAPTPLGEPYKAKAEDKEKVRLLVLELAPAYNLMYMESSGAIRGDGLPKEGIELSKLVEVISGKLLKGPNPNDEPNYEGAVRPVLAQLQSYAGQAGKEQSAGEIDQAMQNASTSAADESLHAAKNVVGEWRSVREVREDKPQMVVEHNDQYYSTLLIYYEGRGIFQTFREGTLFSETRYPWKYNASTGDLSLLGPDGKTVETMKIYAKDSEPDQIYVRQKGRSSSTVYRQFGRGNLPYTEEEIRRMEEGMKNTPRQDSGTGK